MRLLPTLCCLFSTLLAATASAQGHPRDHDIPDSDTRAWWHITEDLSGDSMEGRDTGTAAYGRAAAYVARRFAAAGLKPGGDNGTYLQNVPMHQVDLTPEGTSFVVHRENGPDLPLSFLHEITTTPSPGMPTSGSGRLTFRGYCGADAMKDIAGKVVLCFGTQRTGLPTGGERVANARREQAAGLINIDDPYFTIEPPRWPYAYARSVTLADPAAPAAKPSQSSPMLPPMRLSDAAFTRLLEGSGQDAAAILKAGGAKQPLTSFDLPATFSATLHTTAKDISSPNVLALLPGSDPELAKQYVVVAAHLDGYGFGTPVEGDKLYNGALDDAAYVALLIQMADDLRDGRERHAVETIGIPTGTYNGVTLAAPKRSILFCAFTGEEKGLLGSTWFVSHLPFPSRKWPGTSTSINSARSSR